MKISSIASGMKPYAPQSSHNGDAVSELQRQKEGLTKQLQAVKSKPKNSPADQKAAEKQKKELEKRIANIDQKIQKASQDKNGEASAASQSSETVQAAESSTHQKSSSMQMDELTTASKKNKFPFKATGNIMDISV